LLCSEAEVDLLCLPQLLLHLLTNMRLLHLTTIASATITLAYLNTAFTLAAKHTKDTTATFPRLEPCAPEEEVVSIFSTGHYLCLGRRMFRTTFADSLVVKGSTATADLVQPFRSAGCQKYKTLYIPVAQLGATGSGSRPAIRRRIGRGHMEDWLEEHLPREQYAMKISLVAAGSSHTCTNVVSDASTAAIFNVAADHMVDEQLQCAVYRLVNEMVGYIGWMQLGVVHGGGVEDACWIAKI